jgi:hypothetical protein
LCSDCWQEQGAHCIWICPTAIVITQFFRLPHISNNKNNFSVVLISLFASPRFRRVVSNWAFTDGPFLIRDPIGGLAARSSSMLSFRLFPDKTPQSCATGKVRFVCCITGEPRTQKVHTVL